MIESILGNTVAFDRSLMSGEYLDISSVGLRKGEVFRFHKCGPKCNTATPFKVYREAEFSGRWSDSFALENGEYYFWLEDASGKVAKYGEVVKPKMLTIKDGTYALEFESGSIVKIRLNKSIQPTAKASAD